MLDPEKTYRLLRACGIDFFTGVPDSLLKEFCACVTERSGDGGHVIAANEGGAVALAAGYHLATGGCPLVYMQNSGLGNAVNPLLSLADRNVYAVPMLLMIGWRGEPGVKDEPQHIRQGEVTLPMLEAMGVPAFILPCEHADAAAVIERAHADAMAHSRPVAIVVRKGTFAPYIQTRRGRGKSGDGFQREQALEMIADWAGDRSVLVATTGKTSRELFELRERQDNAWHKQDFLTVGSMGHCSQIALGIAMAQPDRPVVCIDGDGAVLMHTGAMALIGQSDASRFIHIVINNGAHESVGSQPTVALGLDFPVLGKALGYRHAASCNDAGGLRDALGRLESEEGPVLLEIKVEPGSRNDLGRPTLSPLDNKAALMGFLKS